MNQRLSSLLHRFKANRIRVAFSLCLLIALFVLGGIGVYTQGSALVQGVVNSVARTTAESAQGAEFAQGSTLVGGLPQDAPISRLADRRAVDRAWLQAEQAGTYNYATEIVQTTMPLPMLGNVGRTAQTQSLTLEGSVDRPQEQMQLVLWQDGTHPGSLDSGLEILVDGEQAMGRVRNPMAEGEWEEIDDFTGLFAPGGDVLGYLAGAEDVRRVDAQTRLGRSFTRYAFNLDGPRFARFLQEGMQEQLRRTGELAPGMQVDLSAEYEEMEGQGEIWLDEDGFPARMVLDIALPPSTMDQVTARIVTDFSNFNRDDVVAYNLENGGIVAGAGAFVNLQVRAWRNADHSNMIFGSSMFLILMLLSGLLIWQRRSQVTHWALSVAMIMAMVVGPLLQSGQTHAAAVRLDQRATQQATQMEEAQAQQQSMQTATTEWDPHRSPLEQGESAQVEGVDTEPFAATQISTVQISTVQRSTAQAIATPPPATSDNDGDGLTYAQEAALGTWADVDDTDGDGITDGAEVAGFSMGNRVWYLDPVNPDSNGDGLLDSVECPQRLRPNATDPSPTAPCQDTDRDGVPDVFDRDNDGDGVPDSVDLSPFGHMGRTTPFSGDNPFQLVVDDLQPNKPVFVDFQLRPTNPDHLTYAMNVLDWPSGDRDGQIRRIANDTYQSMAQAAGRPYGAQDANGDMRLTPMLEIEMTGATVPLSRTTPVHTVQIAGAVAGRLTFRQTAPNTISVTPAMQPQGDTYEVVIRNGLCASPSAEQVRKTFSGNAPFTIENKNLAELANGSRSITLYRGNDTACAPLGNLVNGTDTTSMIDTAPLRRNGIGILEKDNRGTLLAYVPLTMVADETGGGRVAFGGRMAYHQIGDTWGDAHKVRLVWTVEMLTDQCTTPPQGRSEKEWCEGDQNWIKNQATIVHTYDDNWSLTGLNVTEDHGVEMAAVFQQPNYADPHGSEGQAIASQLWHMAQGLERTFLAGRMGSDGRRDMTVAAIAQRFGAGSAATDEQRWGIDSNALGVERYSLPDQSFLATIPMTHTKQLLDQHFLNQPGVDAPILLFAQEHRTRTGNLDMDSPVVNKAGSAEDANTLTIKLDPTQVEAQTVATVSWAPYQRQGSVWVSYESGAYLIALKERLRAFFQKYPDVYGPNTYNGDIELLNISLAAAYYVAYNRGASSLVQTGNQPLQDLDRIWTDKDVRSIGIKAGKYGGAIPSVVKTLTVELFDLSKSIYIAVSDQVVPLADKAKTAFTVLKDQLYKKSLGEVAGLLNKFLGLSTGKKVGLIAGGALIGAVVITSLVATAVLAPGDVAQKLTQVWNVTNVFMKIGFGVLVIKTAYDTVNTIKSAASVAQGIASAVKTVAVVGALIGLVLGAAVSFGLFVVMVAVGGINFYSPEFTIALNNAFAQFIVSVLYISLGLIPVVGPVLVAIIGLIDAIITAVCGFLPKNVKEGAVEEWVCGGITSLLQKGVLWYNFANFPLVNVHDPNRLDIFSINIAPTDALDGFSVGNKLRVDLSLTNRLRMRTFAEVLAHSLPGALFYDLMYTENALRLSTFRYELSEQPQNIHDQLAWRDMFFEWGYDPTSDALLKIESQANLEKPFSEAGINVNVIPQLYLLEGYQIPLQECIRLPVGLIAATTYVCWLRGKGDTIKMSLGEEFRYDVFPATLTEFYTLVAKDGGYALGWAEETELSFPRLADADGDGLRSAAAGGSDPDDSRWDTDGDGIDDMTEDRLGSDPTQADADGDGLSDREELLNGTSPFNRDTDGDGLSDKEEIDGWAFVYGFDSNRQPLTAWVTSDPNSRDTDGDGLTDAQEKAFGFNPRVASDPTVLTLASSINEAGVASDGYVKPGDTIGYRAEVANRLNGRYAQGLLETDFSAGLSALSPQTFVLQPNQEQTLSGSVTIAPGTGSGPLTLAQNAGSLITDPRSANNNAELLLRLDSDFADTSGGYRPKTVTCSGDACPTLGGTGIPGKAATFDGVNDVLQAEVDISESAYSISMWLKPDSASGGLLQMAAGTLGSLGKDRLLYLYQEQICAQWPTTPALCTSGATPWDSRWHHVVYVNDAGGSGSHSIYVDGVLKATSPAIVSTFDWQTNVNLGYVTDHPIPGNRYYKGEMDEVSLYNYALTLAQIGDLYQQPVLNLRFDNQTAYTDSSNFYNHGTCSAPGCPSANQTGVRGVAMNFDGWNNAVFFPADSFRSNNSLNLSQGNFTLSAWIYPPASAADRGRQAILGKSGGTANGYPSLEIEGRRVWFGFGSNGQWQQSFWDNALTLNGWNHVVVTFAPAADTGIFQARLFVNGQQFEGEKSFSQNVPSQVADFTLGRNNECAVVDLSKILVYAENDNDDNHAGGSDLRLDFSTDNSTWQSIWQQNGIRCPAGPQPYCLIGPPTFDLNFQPRSFCGSVWIRVWENDSDRNWETFEPWDGDDLIGTYRFDFRQPWTTNQNVRIANSQATVHIESTVSTHSIPFQGTLDEVAIYQTALDADAVADLFAGVSISHKLTLDDAPGTTRFQEEIGTEPGLCSGSTCPTAGTAGILNQAALFDGVDDAIQVKGDLPEWPAYAASLWFKTDCADCGLFSATDGKLASAYDREIFLQGGGLCARTWNEEQLCTANTGYADNRWHHVVHAFGPSGHRLYVDGVVAASGSKTDSQFDWQSGFAVGFAGSAGQDYFRGQIDDVTMLRIEVTDSVAQDLYKQAPAVLLHLDEGPNATSFADAAGTATAGCSACPVSDQQGQLGRSLEFKGNSGLFAPLFSSATDNVTLSAWIRWSGPTGGNQIVVQNGSSNTGYGLWLDPNGRVQIVVPAIGVLPSNFVPPVDEWVHLAATREAGVWTIYANGSPVVQSPPGLHPPLTPSTNSFIGDNFDGQARFNGRIDEVSFFNRSLSLRDVLNIYAYQSRWVQDRQTIELTVDADKPNASLRSNGTAYRPNAAVIMHVAANDPTSTVERVEMAVNGGWSDAARCLDAASENAWCPIFSPGGEGRYTLQVRATDTVGNVSDVTGSSTIIVDNTPPQATTTLVNDALLQPVLDTTQANTWRLSLSGTISDPAIGSDPGSGVERVLVTLLDGTGARVGTGQQTAQLTGGNWTVNYAIQEFTPSGRYALRVQTVDKVGNQAGTDLGTFYMDTAAPLARMNRTNIPEFGLNASSGSISGVVAETANIPGAIITLPFEEDANAVDFVNYDGANASCPAANLCWTTGETVGWQNQNSSVTVDLDGVAPLRQLRANFCVGEIEGQSGVFYPDKVTFETSTDGVLFSKVGSVSSHVDGWYALPVTAQGKYVRASVERGGEWTMWTEIEVETSVNVALGKSYTSAPDPSPIYPDTGFAELTDGNLALPSPGASCPASGEAGALGRAVRFDGNDVLTVPHRDGALGRSFAVSAWIQGTFGFIVGKGFENAELQILNGNGLRFIPAGFAQTGLDAPNVLQSGWNHVAAVFDGSGSLGQATIYVNGAQVAYRNDIDMATANNLAADTAAWSIGSRTGSVSNFVGLMDQLQIFNRTLNAEEVQSLAQSRYSGVAGVDVAFTPAFPGSPFHNSTPLPGQIFHAPLDDQPNRDGTLTFRNLAGASGSGSCAQNGGCPQTGVTGPRNGGAGFDGNDVVTFPHRAADSGAPLTDAFSISIWLKWTTGAGGFLLGKGFEQFEIQTGSGAGSANGLRFIPAGYGQSGLDAPNAIQPGWNHVVATYGGGTATIYMNGKQVAQRTGITGAANLAGNTSPWTVGSRAGGVAPFKGDMDDVQVFNRVLSMDEVLGLYWGDGPILHLPLDDTSMTDGTPVTNLGLPNVTAESIGGEIRTVSGKVGNGAAYLEFGQSFSAPLDISETGHTTSLWFRSTQATAGLMQAKRRDLQLDRNVFLSNGRVCVNTLGTPAICGQQTYNDGEWHHIVHTLDRDLAGGNVERLYVDGVEIANGTVNISTYTDTTIVQVGTVTGDFYEGGLDDVRIYGRSMNPEEIAALYRSGWQPANVAGTGGGSGWDLALPAGLEGYYQVDLRAKDSFGNSATSLQNSTPWRGTIDTLAPRMTVFRSWQGTGATVRTQYVCSATDFNLVQNSFRCGLCPTENLEPTQSFFRSGWLASLAPNTALPLYSLQVTCTVPGLKDGPATATACDSSGNCGTATEPTTAARMVAVVQPVETLIGSPTSGSVFTSTESVTISGASTAQETLQSLTVSVDGTPIHTEDWSAQSLTETTWTATWTPGGAGVYTLTATATDDAVNEGTDTIRLLVDLTAPTVAVATQTLSTTHLLPGNTLLITGTVADDTGVTGIEVEVTRQGESVSVPAEVNSDGTTWTAYWTLGEEALPDGESVTVAVTATDGAGRSTTNSGTVSVDVVAPAALTATLNRGSLGSVPVTANSTITDGLVSLGWSESTGAVSYEVTWTIQDGVTGDGALIAGTYAGPATHAYPAQPEYAQAQRVVAQLIARDGAGNITRQDYGPLYVDPITTPDFTTFDPNRPVTPYRGWMNSCTLIGTDYRIRDRGAGGAAQNAAQNLYLTWDAQSLRMAWSGANWDSNGDLFIYLDTVAGGSTRLYDPSGADDTQILLPSVNGDVRRASLNSASRSARQLTAGSQMGADYLIWVQDKETAQLLVWDGSAWQPQESGLLYRFSPDVTASVTDLRLPFAEIGIADPSTASLNMVAVASEDDALRLWATMPSRNSVNSRRIVDVISSEQRFALTSGYRWSGLGADACPSGVSGVDTNGRQVQAAGAPVQYSGANVDLDLASDPPGIAYSILNDDYYFLMDDVNTFENFTDWDALLAEYCEYFPEDEDCEREATSQARAATNGGIDFNAAQGLDTLMDTDQPAVGNGQPLTFTIRYANQGDQLATGIVADIINWGPLRLVGATTSQDEFGQTDNLVLALGDLAPGEEKTITFRGSIDLSFDQANNFGWATLDVIFYDDTGDIFENQLDWFYLDLVLDQDGPDYVEVDPSQKLVGPGQNTIRGRVTDQSAVPTIQLRTVSGDTGAARSITTCVDATPEDGEWTCSLDVQGPADGESVQVQARGTDRFGQESDWSAPRTLIMDATPPIVSVNGISATNTSLLVSGRGPVLNGLISDNRVADQVEVCTVGEDGERCAQATVQLDPTTVVQTGFVYDDVAETPIALNAATSCNNGSEVRRTFEVLERFTVADLDVGFSAAHAFRYDLTVNLIAPDGTSAEILWDGTAAENYDVLLDDGTRVDNAFDDKDHNPVAPYFDNLRRPDVWLSVFNGKEAQGTWTLTICDDFPEEDEGEYYRSRLVFTAATLPGPTNGTWQIALEDVANLDGESRNLAVYAVDRAGNRTSDPVRLDVQVDTTPPLLTAQQISPSSVVSFTLPVLTGSVTDGGGMREVYVTGTGPNGTEIAAPATATNEEGGWRFDLQNPSVGAYTLWVRAEDEAGNQAESGPFGFQVFPPVEFQSLWLPVVGIGPRPGESSPQEQGNILLLPLITKNAPMPEEEME